MGKVESIRLTPRAASTVSAVDADAVLDLLADGHPAAFATDSHDRVVFWNRGMGELLGRRADDALGRRCYEVLAGRDLFGNRFCYANCPVMATLREGDSVHGFELQVPVEDAAARALNVTILKIPGVRPDLFTVLHILAPIREEGRLARLLGQLAAGGDGGSAQSADTGAVVTASPRRLTRRETEVLRHIAAGRQNKEVAQKLGLSLATVRNHVHNILDKLGVHSKLEAVSLAFRNGWVPPEGASGRSERAAR
jgi:DNA-binding CsgD family transcriptional regulator